MRYDINKENAEKVIRGDGGDRLQHWATSQGLYLLRANHTSRHSTPSIFRMPDMIATQQNIRISKMSALKFVLWSFMKFVLFF